MLQRILPATCGLILLIILQVTGILQQVQNSSQDLLFDLRGIRSPSQSIIIVGVDDRSQITLGPWPFPRDLHGAIISRLSSASAIGFDFLFTAPTEQDSLFSKAMHEGPPVVLAVARGTASSPLLPSPTLTGFKAYGHVETLRTGDGIVREVILEQRSGSSFALALYRQAGFSIEPEKDARYRINYLGPQKTFLSLSYLDVLSGKYEKELFANAIVLVGADDQALGDSHATPYSFHTVSPGVEIQATILHNLISRNFLKETRSLNLSLLAMILVLAVIIWPTRSEQLNLLTNTVFLFITAALALIGFQHGLLLDIVQPAALLSLTYLIHLLCQLTWIASKVLRQAHTMDIRLHDGFTRLFHTIPTYLGSTMKSRQWKRYPDTTSGFSQMEAAAEALDLQHDFIENLLSLESPPLIIWERATGKASLTNKLFDELWEKCHPDSPPAPDLISFFQYVSNCSPSPGVKREDLLEERFKQVVIDTVFSLSGSGKRYYRITFRRFRLIDGKFEGILAGLTDVTEIKEMERIKDEIVSIVSHELKLPLTTIFGYGEMLADMSDGKQKKYAEKICQQSKRLNGLIADFLNINRLESGKDTVDRYPCDLKYVVEESIGAVFMAAEKKSIRLESELPAKMTPFLADEQRLLQAFINILENAIKYSPEHTTVRTRLFETSDTFGLIIDDEGSGIPKSQHETVFHKFTRGEYKGDQVGFGLGLSFVQQVTLLHEGNVRVNEKDTAGTCIEFTFPKKSF